MSAIRTAYLEAAESAAAMLRDPAVAQAWDKPSALEEFSTGGLAAHLAAQLFNVQKALDADRPAGEERIGLVEHYARATWVGADLDHETNVAIRGGGEQQASRGTGTLLAQLADSLAELRTALPAEPGDRVVYLPWTGWALALDDFLVTRMMEIAVHSDDLAVSAGIDTPDLPAAVIEPVVDLLTRIAVRRHGQPAVLRALSRAERAPATIAAF
ncbi:MAG TPA: maleylpyruvate isomerase N-terminal domain-containing protein [Kribbellaceae bacterium]|nr:maleylpyruvate isomerase N-terminal domain-containing protein [Kribbellaceae bacterium]